MSNSDKNWVQRHPVISGILGIVLASTIVSAFDGSESGYQADKAKDLPADTKVNLPPKLTASPLKVPESNCHPSYSGCLRKDASDYDCAGGSGNGPHYTGQVNVYGPDVFDLDRDDDGVGCE